MQQEELSAYAGSNGLLFVRQINDLVRMTYRRLTNTISLDSENNELAISPIWKLYAPLRGHLAVTILESAHNSKNIENKSDILTTIELRLERS